MNNRKFEANTWFKNFFLLVLSFALIILIGEWLFPKYLNKVPFRLYGGVESNLRILAQYSKRSVLPENYIAILGDSNSVGVGDLYIDLSKNYGGWYPDYAPAHFLHKKLGRDIVSFGFAGAGTLDGIRSGAVQFEYINSKGFDLKPPKTILILFYEGNDLGNNLQFIREHYEGSESFKKLLRSVKFKKWLDLQSQGSIEENGVGFWESFIFTRFLIQSVKNLYTEKSKKGKVLAVPTLEEKLFSHVVINGKAYPLIDSPGSTIFPKNSISHLVKHGKALPMSFTSRIKIGGKSITQAVVNGEIVPLPGNLQTPPIILGLKIADLKNGLFEDKLRVGYFIFEEALKRMKKQFPDSEVKIIYLPSVSSSYKLISPLTSVISDLGIPSVVGTQVIFQRHLEVCSEIFKISQRLEVGFFDSTKHMLDASSKGYIHGPKDWTHLNESGYRALSDSISQFILHPSEPYQNCTY